jgi:hypothetical protein
MIEREREFSSPARNVLFDTGYQEQFNLLLPAKEVGGVPDSGFPEGIPWSK